MVRYIVIGFVIYFAYRFIFELVIPLYKTTKQVKKQFDATRQNNASAFNQQNHKDSDNAKRPTVDKSDYLDFEEI